MQSESEKLKAKVITELFNSGQLQTKIEGMMCRHNIPYDADIQSDILQEAYYHLAKYPTQKFIQAYKDNPKRILALAVTLALRKGIYQDNRTLNPKHSVARLIMHTSNLHTLNHISSSQDDEEDYNIILKTEDEDINHIEEEYQNMWEYVRDNLSVQDNEVLNILLNPITSSKERKSFKTKYRETYKKIENLITKFKNENE